MRFNQLHTAFTPQHAAETISMFRRFEMGTLRVVQSLLVGWKGVGCTLTALSDFGLGLSVVAPWC